MGTEDEHHATGVCLCFAFRQLSRSVSRLYDEELREVGLRTTQLGLLEHIRRSGEVRQRDLAELTTHEETTLTRNLRPLIKVGWVAVRTGEDRREKWLKVTAAGVRKIEEARPAWERAQARLEDLLPEGATERIMALHRELAQLTAGAGARQ
jgi:DNA-binding MarR family transcriptional regulator